MREVQANVNIGPDGDVSAAIMNKYLLKYDASIMGLLVKIDNYKDMLDEINENFNTLLEDYKITKFNETMYLRDTDDQFIFLFSKNDDGYYFDVYTANLELNNVLFNMIKPYLDISSDTEIIFSKATLANNGVNYSSSVLPSKVFDSLDNDYYPYLDIDEMFSQFNKFNESILCVIGEPGVGKSKLSSSYMKFLINNPQLLRNDSFDYNVLYIKSEDVLASDDLWSSISNAGYDLIILDDLDYLFGKRGSVNTEMDVNKNKFISNLLSFTDGVEDNRTKIIISTNRNIKEVDEAVLRKGRMFDILDLRALYKDEALNIWLNNDLSEDSFNEIFSTEIVLQSDLGSEIDKRKKETSDRRHYVLEDGISKINKYKNQDNIGFM